MRIIYVYDTIAVVGGIERIFVDKMNYLADHLHTHTQPVWKKSIKNFSNKF